jgi:hypothetical protein
MERAAPTLGRRPYGGRLRHLVDIEEYLHEDRNVNSHPEATTREQLHTKVEAILAWPEWVSMVRERLESDDAREVASVVRVAEALGVDTRPTLWSWLAREPLDDFFWYRLSIGASREEMRRLIDAAAALLPLDELTTWPSDDVAQRRAWKANQCLLYVLQGLYKTGEREATGFPGEGWNVISVGLRCGDVRIRIKALRALSGWTRDQWPEDAEDLLQEAFRTESDESVRLGIRAVIDGAPLPW